MIASFTFVLLICKIFNAAIYHPSESYGQIKGLSLPRKIGSVDSFSIIMSVSNFKNLIVSFEGEINFDGCSVQSNFMHTTNLNFESGIKQIGFSKKDAKYYLAYYDGENMNNKACVKAGYFPVSFKLKIGVTDDYPIVSLISAHFQNSKSQVASFSHQIVELNGKIIFPHDVSFMMHNQNENSVNILKSSVQTDDIMTNENIELVMTGNDQILKLSTPFETKKIALGYESGNDFSFYYLINGEKTSIISDHSFTPQFLLYVKDPELKIKKTVSVFGGPAICKAENTA
jgi:hypothetical protein